MFAVAVIFVAYRRQRHKSKKNHKPTATIWGPGYSNSSILDEDYNMYADNRGLLPNRGSIVNPYPVPEIQVEPMQGEIWRVNPLYMDVEEMEEEYEQLDSTKQPERASYQLEEQEEEEELEDKPIQFDDENFIKMIHDEN